MLSLKPLKIEEIPQTKPEAHISINLKNKNTSKSDNKNIYPFQICKISNLDILLDLFLK
jgi:hypothetical protein